MDVVNDLVLPVLKVLAFGIGVLFVWFSVLSAIRTFVLPRTARDPVARRVFLITRQFFNFRTRRAKTYLERDRIMELYAPISLLLLLLTWLIGVLVGYMFLYWTFGITGWRTVFTVSGSSLLTLGFASVSDVMTTILAFSEAVIGLILVALLISYLPTMYSAFSRREAVVSSLEVRAGSPPSAVEMIKRFYLIRGLDELDEVWIGWEAWFLDIEESHTSLGPLSFFRSPQPQHSWVTAAGAVLDAAAIYNSTLDIPKPSPRSQLCLRAGYISLQQISTFFRLNYEPNPRPTDPISVTRAEFEVACDELASTGVPIKADRDQCWRDFAGWRVNYDTVLLSLAALTMSPEAPWSSDRSLRQYPPPRRKAGKV